MRVAEIYSSVQGEGRLTGTPSVFVRASGCNLRCVFCDTPFASWRPEGDDLSIEQIVAQVDQGELSHVVLTGGEPMLFSELVPLCTALQERGYHITIETAGTLYLPLSCDLMSISPKLSNSTPARESSSVWHQRHELTRERPEVIRRLIAEHPYQLKFVVGCPGDVEEVDRFLERISPVGPAFTWLMPEGTDPRRLAEIESWLRPYCESTGLQFCPRRQIEWYGDVRGT